MTQEQKKPQKKKVQKKKKGRAKAWFYSIFFTFVLGVIAVIAGYLFIIVHGEKILAENVDKLNFTEASVLYDIDGNEISKLYDVNSNREVAEFSEIPKIVIDAFVATEDRRFYEHSGLDFISIGRALIKDIIAGSAVEGGSTITQQLAKNVFLKSEKTILRKATEASIAVALEQHMSKDEIITMYLNRIYFGKGIHGIKAAAEYYFDTPLEELEVWQAATLAGMPKAPNRYNPVNNPEASMERRAVVLQLMYQEGIISEAERDKAKAVEYVEPAHVENNPLNSQYTAFIDFAIEEAIEVTGMSEEELRVGGYSIYTTLDATAQNAMDKQFENDENFEKSVDDQISQAAMIIMDHSTGQIKALAGGRDYVKKGSNRVNHKQQPGSTFKPLIAYGPALETGNFTPSTILKIDKTCFNDYCPKDNKGAVDVSMKTALTESRNLAAVWLLNEIGLKTANQFLTKLGLGLGDNDWHLGSALGGLSQGVTPLQMATAYSVIANDGMSVDPHTILKIEGKNGTKYEYTAPKAERLMKESTANYLTEMMVNVVKEGTGKRAQISNREVAGKTGTSQHGISGLNSSANRNVWFVGYTPEWTAAVWMGYDKVDAEHLLQKGSSQAASLFAKVMEPALKNTSKKSFDFIVSKPEEPEAVITVSELAATYSPEEISVTLNWKVDYESIASFEVFRKEQGSDTFSHFAETEGTTMIKDVSVFPGETYQYYVVGYDPELELYSEPSNVVEVVVPEGDLFIPDVPMENDENLDEGNPFFPTNPEDEEPTTPEESINPEVTPSPEQPTPSPPLEPTPTPTPPTPDPSTPTPGAGDEAGGVTPPVDETDGEAQDNL